MKRFRVALILIFLLPLGLAGCGGEDRVAVHPVSGRVLYQGQAAEGAQVVLHPVAPAEVDTPVVAARVQPDGTFKVGAYEADDGAPPGEYVATVEWFRVVASEGSGGRGPNILPPKYARPETSPLRVSVRSGSNQLPAFDVSY